MDVRPVKLTAVFDEVDKVVQYNLKKHKHLQKMKMYSFTLIQQIIRKAETNSETKTGWAERKDYRKESQMP